MISHTFILVLTTKKESPNRKKSFAQYRDFRFERGCLLARRLLEEGDRFIEVTTEYFPFLHWDHYENGHTTSARMKKEVDQPIAQLILDFKNADCWIRLWWSCH